MREILPLIISLASLVFLITLVPQASALGVEGVIFEAEASPGQHVSHEMTVSLKEDEAPLDLQVEVQDWGQALDGINQKLEEGTPAAYSAKGFLNVSPSSFHLLPGGAQKVMVEGDIPSDVGSGGRYALIGIYSLIPEADEESSEGNVGLAVAINALVRLTISGTELIKRGEITDLKIDKPVSGRERNLSLIFKNTGNYHFKAVAKASLKDNEGDVLAEATTPPSSNIIPDASRLFEISLKPERDFEPKNCRINAIVETEEGALLAAKEVNLAE